MKTLELITLMVRYIGYSRKREAVIYGRPLLEELSETTLELDVIWKKLLMLDKELETRNLQGER